MNFCPVVSYSRPLRSGAMHSKLVCNRNHIGAWLSLARAPGSGPGGRWFKSTRPDHFLPIQLGDMRYRAYLARGLQGLPIAALGCRASYANASP